MGGGFALPRPRTVAFHFRSQTDRRADGLAARPKSLQMLIEQYARCGTGLPDACQRMAAVVGTADSGDRFINASVSYRGELTSLEIDPVAFRSYDSLTLSETIPRWRRRPPRMCAAR
jgi:hypothetical protein